VRRRTDLRRNDGVAMTEFALIVPVFLLIVVGLLGFGRVFFYWIGANHLANETARWAVVDRNPDPAKYPPPDANALQKYARDNGGTVEFTDAKVCINYLGVGTTPALGEPIQVKISKQFTFVPLLGIGTITIRGSSTMRIERFANANGTVPSYSYSTSSAPAAGAPFGACT
jgi:TadE-like protein